MRAPWPGAAGLVLLVALAAPTPVASGTNSNAAVTILGPNFVPENVTVLVSDGFVQLDVFNLDKGGHWPIDGPHNGAEGFCFDVGFLWPHSTGSTWIDPTNPACATTVSYHCHLHPWMRGNITLQAVPGPSST